MNTVADLLRDLDPQLQLALGAAAAVAVLATVLYAALSSRRQPQKTLLPLEDFIQVPLIDKKIVSHDTRRFTFALPREDDVLGLKVGQHLALRFVDPRSGQSVQRSYTPVSCDSLRGRFSLVVKVYPALPPKFPAGGAMSQHLDRLAIGDTIDMRGPKGHVEYQHAGRFRVKPLGKPLQTRVAHNLCLMAGGTGITPMLQVIDAILTSPNAPKNQDVRLKLLYANQTPDDILLRDELEALQRRFPDRLSVWYTVDRLPENGDASKWKYSTGFITKPMIQEYCWFGDNEGRGRRTQFLLCGPPPMIKFACLPALTELGCTENDWIVF